MSDMEDSNLRLQRQLKSSNLKRNLEDYVIPTITNQYDIYLPVRKATLYRRRFDVAFRRRKMVWILVLMLEMLAIMNSNLYVIM